MSKPKSPPTPDYAGAAQQQGQANLASGLQTAQLSNPNIVSPYGNQSVSYNGNIPTVTQTLTPTGQQTVDQQQQAELGLSQLANQQIGKVGGILGSPFEFNGQVQGSPDLSGVAPIPVNAGTTGQQAIMSRLEPNLQLQRKQLETQLVNQGLRPGAEAYDNAINLLGQQENDARQQAVVNGLNLDLGANQQGYGQALNTAGFQNSAIAQQLQQALAQRDLPLNEITGLLSGSQIQNPQFNAYQGANVAAAPVFQGAQAQDAYNQNVYNQQMAAHNALLGGLSGLGGAATKGLFGLFS